MRSGSKSAMVPGSTADVFAVVEYEKDAVDREPVFVARLAFVGEGAKQYQHVEDDDVRRSGRVRPERDQQVAEGPTALPFNQGQADDVYD